MQRLCDGPSALLLGCPDWRQVWCRAAALGRPLVAALGVAGVQSYFLLSRCYSSGYINMTTDNLNETTGLRASDTPGKGEQPR